MQACAAVEIVIPLTHVNMCCRAMDNAVAESFFHLLKRERIRRQPYLTRDEVRQDMFGDIEMFYNPTRKHTKNGMLSRVGYEMKQEKMKKAGV